MNVLIGVDDSAESRDAVTTAFEFFGSQATYTIASIGNRTLSSSGALFVAGYPAGGYLDATELGLQFDQAESAAEATAREAEQQLPPSAEVSIDKEVGHVGQQLCRLAEEHTCDVLVIGPHDKNVWQRLLEPSVGRYLIDNASCPVLIVR